MATADTAPLSDPHSPKEASIMAFGEFEAELRRLIIHERHDKAKHDLPYFAAAEGVSDHDLATFSVSDWVLVRHAPVAYGHILFGKLRVPALAAAGNPNCYIHFRAFEPEASTEEAKAEVHSIHTERLEQPNGSFHYRALFTEEDPLEWFDT
jgi:hypothetical protein